MDPQATLGALTTLTALGLTLPGPGEIAASIVFGLIGIWAWRRGKQRSRPLTRWTGLALMLYPYVVSGTWLLVLCGCALCGVLYMDRGAGD